MSCKTKWGKSLLNAFSVVFLCALCLLSPAIVASCATSGKSSAGSGGALEEDSAVVSGTLENGMKYKILRNAEPENRIFLRLAVQTGSVYEDDDQKGVAHLIEHMAFNGTEHFHENELVDYFESIGMSFGPEVNAYTSFDETVYMLEIPADDAAALEKALLVLSDWAATITFDQTELDKERGVVIEEWRLGRGASGRIQDAQVPLLYGDSMYARRLPIGDPEIVRTIPRERIVDFYEAWYRPERMTAIIVGDCDPVEMEKSVAAILGTVPVAEGTREYPSFSIPPRTEKAVQVLQDPELSYTVFQIITQLPPPEMVSEADFRSELVRRMLFSIFSDRLDETLVSADSFLLDAGCGMSVHKEKAAYVYASGVPKEGMFREAFSFVMEKVAQLQRWGVSEAEVARAKDNFLNMAEQSWLNRDKVSSARKASSLLNSALHGEPALSAETTYRLYNELVPGISADDLNNAVEQYFPGSGTLVLVSGSSSGAAGADIPSEEELMRLWTEWTAPEDLEPYSEDELARPLFDREVPLGGKVVSKEAAPVSFVNQEGRMEIWKLSNGATMLVNPTSFKPNEILFSAFSPGGLSLVSDDDYLSGSVADSYAEASGLNGFTVSQLEKKLAGKTVSLSLAINNIGETISGGSSNADLETLLQLVNLSFTAPYFTDDAWASLISASSMEAANRLSSPDERFSDAVLDLRYGDNIRFKNLTPETVRRMDQATAERIYRERFANAGDFVFVFTGSFEKDELEHLVSTYLASLPSSPEREKTDVSKFPPFPESARNATVYAGIEDRATVYVSYGGVADAGPEDFELFDSLCLLLDIRLRELVRERLGGTYGVYAYGGLSSSVFPSQADGGRLSDRRQYSLSIQFGCDPAAWETLLSSVVSELRTLTERPVSENYMNKLTETYRRTVESGARNNSYIHSRLLAGIQRGFAPGAVVDANDIEKKITAEKMREMAEKYIRFDACISAVLLPETRRVGD